MPRTLTQEEVDIIIGLSHGGSTVKEIADSTGMSMSTISKYVSIHRAIESGSDTVLAGRANGRRMGRG